MDIPIFSLPACFSEFREPEKLWHVCYASASEGIDQAHWDVARTIVSYYQNDCLDDLGVLLLIQPVVREALKNGVLHGPTHEVHAGVYCGDLGVCYGFYDGGAYFRDEEVKRRWERREPIPHMGRRDVGKVRGGFGAGDDMIFTYAEGIFVDLRVGILYCTQLKEHVLYWPKSA